MHNTCCILLLHSYLQNVSVLIATHPALLEMSPNTLKARLESLAALFGVPTAAAAQLLLRHPGLAAIPPNVTITRAKGLSMALKCSMARAGELIAKVRQMEVSYCCACAVYAAWKITSHRYSHAKHISSVLTSQLLVCVLWQDL